MKKKGWMDTGTVHKSKCILICNPRHSAQYLNYDMTTDHAGRPKKKTTMKLSLIQSWNSPLLSDIGDILQSRLKLSRTYCTVHRKQYVAYDNKIPLKNVVNNNIWPYFEFAAHIFFVENRFSYICWLVNIDIKTVRKTP